MSRPPFIVHWQDLETTDDAHYPDSDELLSLGAPLGRQVGLTKLGVHHELLPPGRRTSWPHAEADEDELVYVLEGHPHVWVDGELHALRPGDAVGFPSGTGIAHTFLNDGDRPVRLLAIGEASRPGHRIHYPLHPARNASLGERHWRDVPARPLGPHEGSPRAPSRTPLSAPPREERLALPTLETARLVLRPHVEHDAPDVFDMRRQPGASRFARRAPPASLSRVEAAVRRVCAQNGWGMIGWTILERDTGRFVGTLGVLRLDSALSRAEVGYEVHRAQQRRGYAREATARVVAYAFEELGLHRVELSIDPENTPSLRIAEALGFTREGVLRDHERHEDGRWLDVAIYARLSER